MKWLWNNAIVPIYCGAGLMGLGFVSTFIAFIGLGDIFRGVALAALAAGIVSILLGVFIFCLQFGVRSKPKKVIGYALSAQLLLATSFILFHEPVNFYSRLYSPGIGLILGGLFFVMSQTSALLLLIGVIRIFLYSPRPS